jgi:DNA-directed RNA polymerase specialized sigma24 family protein
LVAITERKVADQIRRARRRKRGAGRVCSEADLARGGPDDEVFGFDRIAGAEPTPEFAAEFADEYRRLFDALRDDELRRIAVWRLEGHSVDEIAALLGCARRTAARRLALIRMFWRTALR